MSEHYDQREALYQAHKDSSQATQQMVRCGDCQHFKREGQCDYLTSPEGKAKDRPFSHAPFWVWSDCYSDKEQVRSGVASLCPTFAAKATGAS